MILIEGDVLLLHLEKNGEQGRSLSQCGLRSVWMWYGNGFLREAMRDGRVVFCPTPSEDKHSGCPGLIFKKPYGAGLIFKRKR